jgi:hypothetical protein
MTFAWVGCLVPVWLGDNVSTENSHRGFHSWLEIPHVGIPQETMVTTVTKVTTVIKVAWGFLFMQKSMYYLLK